MKPRSCSVSFLQFSAYRDLIELSGFLTHRLRQPFRFTFRNYWIVIPSAPLFKNSVINHIHSVIQEFGGGFAIGDFGPADDVEIGYYFCMAVGKSEVCAFLAVPESETGAFESAGRTGGGKGKVCPAAVSDQTGGRGFFQPGDLVAGICPFIIGSAVISQRISVCYIVSVGVAAFAGSADRLLFRRTDGDRKFTLVVIFYDIKIVGGLKNMVDISGPKGRSPVIVDRTQPVIIGQRVLDKTLKDLFFVAHALDRMSPLFRLVQSGQQHRGQDRDDRNDHEELDQREAGRFTLQV